MPLSKKPLGIVFALVLLFSVVAATQFINLGKANPYSIAQRCAQMVKNGFKSVFAYLSLLWTRLMSAS